jgi:ABC-type multidrug transport system fused ATPase/permease subunit
MNKKSSLKSFISYVLVHYKGMSLVLLLALCMGAALDASTALLVAPIFDLIMKAESVSSNTELNNYSKAVFDIMERVGIPQTAIAALLIFLFISLIRNLFVLFSDWLTAKIRSALVLDLKINAFSSVMNSQWKFFLGRNQGSFINTLTRETEQTYVALFSGVRSLSCIIQVVFFSSIAVFVSFKLTLSCLAIAIVAGIPFLKLSKLNHHWGRKTVTAAAGSNVVIQESFSLSKIIQAFAKQDTAIESLQQTETAKLNCEVKMSTLTSAVQQLYYPLGLLTVVSGYYFSQRMDISFAELSIVLYALWKAIPFLSSFNREYSNLMRFLPSFENVCGLQESARENELQSGDRGFYGLKKSIEIKELSFQYEGTDFPALNEVSLTINKGHMVALVGSSGSGKSTLADIVMGFHKPQSGELIVDGAPFESLDIQSYRKTIGYVPQQSVLFNTSIKENMLWAAPDATDDDLLVALKLANCTDFVNDLPKGIDTAVGDRGIRLSGGQVQRLAIARAVIRKPEILILDEATSALDSESEKQIQSAIDQIAHSTTMIVIAHRLSTIRNADMIYVMEDGKLKECGNYEQLMELDEGLFKMMWNEQV